MYKPVILIGAGCSRDNAERLCKLNIPVLTTWQGIDLVAEDNPSFCGRPGIIGQRAANIIQQKATHVYIFGARMDGEQVGHRMDRFAPNAQKYVYDYDKAELGKFPSDWLVQREDLINSIIDTSDIQRGGSSWLEWCKNLYATFRPELDGDNCSGDYVDPYYFIKILSDVCRSYEVIVPGSSGMQSCAFLQAFKVKRGQRIMLCNTIGAMGLEPMAIGASLASAHVKNNVVCITGDGGFYLNVQELEVVSRLHLPIKFFVFCNDGYGSISTMQDQRFNLRVGADPESGFTVPDLSRIAAVWSFSFHEIRNNADINIDRISNIINIPDPAIIRVHSSLAFRYACKVQSGLQGGVFENDPMEDMTPKIDGLKELMAWDG